MHRNERGQFRRAKPEDLARAHGAAVAEYLNTRKPLPPWLIPSPSTPDAERAAVSRDMHRQPTL